MWDLRLIGYNLYSALKALFFIFIFLYALNHFFFSGGSRGQTILTATEKVFPWLSEYTPFLSYISLEGMNEKDYCPYVLPFATVLTGTRYVALEGTPEWELLECIVTKKLGEELSRVATVLENIGGKEIKEIKEKGGSSEEEGTEGIETKIEIKGNIEIEKSGNNYVLYFNYNDEQHKLSLTEEEMYSIFSQCSEKVTGVVAFSEDNKIPRWMCILFFAILPFILIYFVVKDILLFSFLPERVQNLLAAFVALIAVFTGGFSKFIWQLAVMASIAASTAFISVIFILAIISAILSGMATTTRAYLEAKKATMQYLAGERR